MVKFIRRNKEVIYAIIICLAFIGMLMYFGSSMENHFADINYVEVVNK